MQNLPPPSLISTIRTVPSLVVLLLPLPFSIPPFKQLGNRLAFFSSDFVTLRSLIPPEPATAAQKADEQARRPQAWKEFVLAALSLAEAAAWTAITGWKILQFADGNDVTLRDALLSVGMVVVWVSHTVLGVSRCSTSILTPYRATAWDLFELCLSTSHHPSMVSPHYRRPSVSGISMDHWTGVVHPDDYWLPSFLGELWQNYTRTCEHWSHGWDHLRAGKPQTSAPRGPFAIGEVFLFTIASSQ